MIGSLGPWRMTAAASAAALTLGAAGGWSVRDGLADRTALAQERSRATAALAALRQTGAAQAEGTRIGLSSAERQTQIRYRTQEIIREVPIHVTQDADHACAVPWGFVRLHDQAAAGEPGAAIPSAAAPPHDAASGVALSSVAETVAGNYGDCRADQERLTSLQAWIKAQADLWNDAR